MGDEFPQEISNFQGLCSFVNLWEGNMCVQLQLRFQFVYDEIVTEGGANAAFQLKSQEYGFARYWGFRTETLCLMGLRWLFWTSNLGGTVPAGQRTTQM